MNALKINWLVSGDIAETTLFEMKFTVRADKEISDHRDCYLVESCHDAKFSEPLFTELKAVGIHCAKKLAEDVIIEFICSELRKANEDE